jgi:hypothetical protein
MTKISRSKIFLTECHAQIDFERGLLKEHTPSGRDRLNGVCFDQLLGVIGAFLYKDLYRILCSFLDLY